MGEYRDEAISDAKDSIREYLDQIVEHLIDYDSAPTDPMNDLSGFDAYHHESHVDKDYRLLDAAQLLDDLHEFEETDDGLWMGQSPRAAIATQAAFTYGAAVISMVYDYMKEIGEDDTITEIIAAYNANEDDFTGEDGSPNSAYTSTKEQILTNLKARILEIIE